MLYKRYITIILLFLVTFLLSISLSVQGFSIKDVPNPQTRYQDWVSDRASVLSSQTEQTLNRQITAFESYTSVEMAIVTIPNVALDTTVRQFAISLFNEWGIGKAIKNNGILLLLSMGDRRVELVIGKGIDHLLTDDIADTIIRTQMLPALRQGSPNRAVLEGTTTVLVTLGDALGTAPVSEIPVILIPVIISSVLFGGFRFSTWKLCQLRRENPSLFTQYHQMLEEGTYFKHRRQDDETRIDFSRRFIQWQRRRTFAWMLSLTSFLLISVGYYVFVCTAIVLSLCFPLTFGLKNLTLFSRQGVRQGTTLQALLSMMFIGVSGTLVLVTVYQHSPNAHISWFVTFSLAIGVSVFNTINWHQFLDIRYGGSSSRSRIAGETGGYSSGTSAGGSSSSQDSDSSFGGGSSDGGGAGGSW